MALRRTRPVQGLSGSATGGGAESQSSMISHINFEMKQAGKPSAGNPHAGFDVAGAGDRLTVRLVRHSQRKRGAMDRPDLRGDWRQSSTLPMRGCRKRAASRRACALLYEAPVGYRRVHAHRFTPEFPRRSGKQRRIYRWYATAWEILRQTPDMARYLRSGMTRAELERQVSAESATEAARRMQEAKQKLLGGFRQKRSA